MKKETTNVFHGSKQELYICIYRHHCTYTIAIHVHLLNIIERDRERQREREKIILLEGVLAI